MVYESGCQMDSNIHARQKKERPEQIRLGDEITQFLIKRETSLADALTSTMLTAIEATCGRERADEFDLLMAGFSKEVISGEQVQ